MKTELRYSWPSAEGVNPEYIVNFLNACEKADSEIHGIMIARHGNVIFEAIMLRMQQRFRISCIPSRRH